MELLFNDLSIHGQFNDLDSFGDAIRRLMAIRGLINVYGASLYSHRNILQSQVTPDITMYEAVDRAFTLAEKRALMQWITRFGPFWDDVRRHQPEDWFQHRENIVTDTAIGEAAWCLVNNIDRELISLSPSDWEYTPISVDWFMDKSTMESVNIANYWLFISLEDNLKSRPRPYSSWEGLEAFVTHRYNNLTYLENAFAPLVGHPFSPAAAERIIFLLGTLNHYTTCFDGNGQRTTEGNEIYQKFFTGGELFSDSSATEKKDFKKALTFRHPIDNDLTLICPYHGKIKHQQLRLHFSWPIRAEEPVFVAYVGPKITKQ